MNQPEFANWLRYLTSGYPAIATWLADNEGAASIWWEVLKDTDEQDARAVVAEMFRGDRDLPAYSHIPATIRKAAAELSFERRSTVGMRFANEETFRCSECKDSGLITVANPRQPTSKLRNPPENWEEIPDEEWTIPVWLCSVACHKCVAGERWNAAKWSKSPREGLVMFDPERMCRMYHSWPSKTRFAALQRFWSEYVDPRRYREFDNWNEGAIEVATEG